MSEENNEYKDKRVEWLIEPRIGDERAWVISLSEHGDTVAFANLFADKYPDGLYLWSFVNVIPQRRISPREHRMFQKKILECMEDNHAQFLYAHATNAAVARIMDRLGAELIPSDTVTEEDGVFPLRKLSIDRLRSGLRNTAEKT